MEIENKIEGEVLAFLKEINKQNIDGLSGKADELFHSYLKCIVLELWKYCLKDKSTRHFVEYCISKTEFILYFQNCSEKMNFLEYNLDILDDIMKILKNYISITYYRDGFPYEEKI